MVNRSRNMRKNRSRGRSRGRRMRGGGFMDFFSSSGKKEQLVVQPEGQSEKPGFFGNITDALSNSRETGTNLLGQADELVAATEENAAKLEANTKAFATEKQSAITTGVSNFFGAPVAPVAPVAPGTPVAPVAQTSWLGGYKRSKQMRMKGGQNLGLNYYATSVNGIKMAQPTYMEYYKGGKRRKTCKRRRSCKRQTCKRRTCKRHRRR